MSVFVLDKRKRPLMPYSEKRARLLLDRGRAVVVKLHPFTIRLKDRVGGGVQPVWIKLDPGSKTTGIAIVRESEAIDVETGTILTNTSVLWLAELSHRGHQIRDALTARRAMRRRRRVANLRYRAPPSLAIKATGRGSYQRTRLTWHGFPRGYLTRQKQKRGFQTGDQVIAIVPTGKKAGTHTGRIAVRSSGSFNIQTATGVVQGISHRHCRVLQRADGYGYSIQPKIALDQEEVARKAV